MLYEVITMSEQIDWSKLSEVEKLKYDSNYLRGTLVESLADPVTGAIADGDTQLSKFHGIRITSYNVCYTKLLRSMPE